MDTQKTKKENKKAYSLLGSFILLLVVSIGAFTYLGNYIGNAGEDAINRVGNLYMAGINDHITAHFRTMTELKLEQEEAIIAVVPADMDDMEALYEELVYRARVRNFTYLALCAEDGTMEMLSDGEIELTDPEPFFESLRNHEKKIAIGRDDLGNEIVLFGINADYPMKNGEKCMAMVAAVSIEYITTLLSTDEEDALIYSHIIKSDGTFIVSDISDEYDDYFSSLYDKYSEDTLEQIVEYAEELRTAMEEKKDYAVIIDFLENIQQVYCAPLPYSEWYLVTILPSGALNETVKELNREQEIAMVTVGIIILVMLLGIFFAYFRMSRRQMRDLEAAREEALEATKAKSSFLSNMSHDIRTPMNAIVGMTAIATAHIDDKEQVQNCLRKITLSGKHLLGLINDVLDMSKIESGKMTLTEELISLKELMEAVVSIVQTQIKAKEQHFQIHIDSIKEEKVYSDSVRLNQVLLNLLSNAVKYTQEGGTIQLYLFQENEPPEKGEGYVRTHVIVRDNGIGMTKEFAEHVFDSYTRADNKRVHKIEGTGLGMAITKYIVDAMGGSISVKSELNKGTEFHVILDFEIGETEEMDMILPAWKMLVVDDDETLCHTVVDALDSIGIRADWTLSGEEALKMVKKHHQMQDEYQIILLDWKLPETDGLQLTKQIRRVVDADMSIILMSAYDWNEFEEEARSAGIDGFISKPLFKSTLFHGLKKYMGMESAADKEGAGEDINLTGRRVLVAEDNELNWEILKDLLGDIGLELDWAENGKICLEKFKESGEKYYDAILMDVRMPVMNGYEATEAIRALDREDAGVIPIIAMTADAFSEDIKQCLDSGMNAHTAKPINLDEVISLLKKYIV